MYAPLKQDKAEVMADRPTVVIDWWNWKQFSVHCPLCGKGRADIDLNIPEMNALHGGFSYQARMVRLDCSCNERNCIYQAVFPVDKDGKNGTFEIDKENSRFVRLGYTPENTPNQHGAIMRSDIPARIKEEWMTDEHTCEGNTKVWLQRGGGSRIEQFSAYKSRIEPGQSPPGLQLFDNWTVETLGTGEYWDIAAFKVRTWKASQLAEIMNFTLAPDKISTGNRFDPFAHPVKQAVAACVWKHAFVDEKADWIKSLEKDIDDAANLVKAITMAQSYQDAVAEPRSIKGSFSGLLKELPSPSSRPSRIIEKSFASINAELDTMNGKTFGGWLRNPEISKHEKAVQKLETLKGLRQRVGDNNRILKRIMPPNVMEIALYIGENAIACEDCREFVRKANRAFNLDMRITATYPPAAIMIEGDAEFDAMSEDGMSYYGSSQEQC